MVLIAAGSLVVGLLIDALATSIAVAILGRVVQGLGGGLLPLTYGILRDELPPAQVPAAIALMASLIGVGAGVGVVLAGPIVDTLGYHWLFWIPLAIVGGAAVAAVRVIPESRMRAPGRLNPTAAALMAAWLSALLLGLSEGARWGWTSATTLSLAAVATLGFALWAAVEKRAAYPLIDLQMMRLPGVGTTNAVALLAGADMYAAYAFLPRFAEARPVVGYGFGASVTEAGLILLPASAAALVMGLIIAPITRRIGARVVVVTGSLLTAISMAMLIGWHSAPGEIAASAAVLGIGIGVAFGSLSSLIVRAVPAHQTGAAGGMTANVRTIGGSVGTALFGAVLAGGHSGLHAYDRAFLLLAVLALVGAAAGLLVPGDEPALAHATQGAHA
jgi:MFS family permease